MLIHHYYFAETVEDSTISGAKRTWESKAESKFYEKAEKLCRQVESDIYYIKQYVSSQLRRLRSQLPRNPEQDILARNVEDVKHYFR